MSLIWHVSVVTFAILVFLAHQIRIPVIENLIFPILYYPGCHVRATYISSIETHAHGRQVSHCYVKVTSSCEIAS